MSSAAMTQGFERQARGTRGNSKGAAPSNKGGWNEV